MTHLNGLTSSEVSHDLSKPICMSHAQNEDKPSPLEDAFKIVESHLRTGDGLVFVDHVYENGSTTKEDRGGPFYGLQMEGDRLIRLCFNLPIVSIQKTMNQKQEFSLYPEVTLAYMIVDLEVGLLINGLRQMHLPHSGSPPLQFMSGIENYLRQGQLEDSMFETTLFLFYGDHGMVNTFNEMSLPLGTPAERINRQATSMSKPFSQVLAESLGLSVFEKGAADRIKQRLGDGLRKSAFKTQISAGGVVVAES